MKKTEISAKLVSDLQRTVWKLSMVQGVSFTGPAQQDKHD